MGIDHSDWPSHFYVQRTRLPGRRHQRLKWQQLSPPMLVVVCRPRFLGCIPIGHCNLFPHFTEPYWWSDCVERMLLSCRWLSPTSSTYLHQVGRGFFSTGHSRAAMMTPLHSSSSPSFHHQRHDDAYHQHHHFSTTSIVRESALASLRKKTGLVISILDLIFNDRHTPALSLWDHIIMEWWTFLHNSCPLSNV